MEAIKYLDLKAAIIDRGYGDDVDWAESVQAPKSAEDFSREHAFVVCNSGMRAQTAVKIFWKVRAALESGQPLGEVFGHKGKCKAIQEVWDNRAALYAQYMALTEPAGQIEFLHQLPFIGDIVKYHLAKNFGADVCKPDRHLVRIAESFNTNPDDMCKKLADITGDRIGTVDVVIWRAANLRLI